MNNAHTNSPHPNPLPVRGEGNSQSVRVRIPPSPTGNLHVGTARTALFNELFARKANGKIVLRFEDTDKARSKTEFEENIQEGLGWLGITCDEGPYRQSERTERYTAELQRLLDEDKAYLEGQAIRLRVTPHPVTFHDEVRGDVTVHTDSFEGDFVIARNVTDPLYHIAVVVDDFDMNITHVIRGEDHLHNTIKHILIQEALGYERPVYAHLPLLLDDQRKKLSKRKAETNLLSYRDMGFLPEAMLNYLALLGWNNGDDREFYTHEELINAFSLERVQRGGAIFSIKKLSAVNKKYLSKLSDEALLAWGMYHYAQHSIVVTDTERLLRALKVERSRCSSYDIDSTSLYEAMRWHEPLWKSAYSDVSLIFKTPREAYTPELKKKTKDTLSELIALLTNLPEDTFTAEKLQDFLMSWIDSSAKNRGEVLWPMRVALTGKQNSAGPFEVSEVLGKTDVLARLQNAHESLS